MSVRGPRLRDRLSIQQEIGAAIFAVAVGLSAVALWYFPRQAAELNEQALLKNALLTADIVQVDVLSSFEMSREDLVQEDLVRFGKRLGVEYAAVVLDDGTVLASAGEPSLSARSWTESGAFVDGLVAHAQVPIQATDGRTGWVRVGLDVTGLHDQNRKNLFASAVLLAIALSAILLIAIKVSQALSAPLRQMSSAAELLARGEWEHASRLLNLDAADDTRNEALHLQQTLSRMSDSLQRQEAQLLSYNEQLEAQVARQTAELRAAAEKSQKATEAKSLFLANMSHEIRTPMVGVLGLVDLLLRSEVTEEQRERLLTLQQSGEALIRVINDILDFSKIEAGKLSLDPIDYAPRDLLLTVSALMRQVATQRGLEFQVDIAAELPARLRGDAHRIRQILLNLLSNAIKFTPEGRVAMVARVTTDSAAQSIVEVAVEDTGIGIPEAQQADLFSAFHQADDSTTRRFGGTGLGLSISKQLADLMGGDILLKSTEGSGSCFTLVFPLTLAESQAPPSPAPADATTGELMGRVLLVEDNPVNQLVGRSLLEQLGLAVELAVDGRQAVERARDFDLVLMDCQMPVMDGFEATRRIRALGIRIPILALTADLVDDRRAQCLAAGMNGFIGKPVRLNDLRAELQRYLPRRPSSAGLAAEVSLQPIHTA